MVHIVKQLAIVDYGLGNIKSISNALNEIGCKGELVNDPNRLLSYDKIILPGVGAFSSAIDNLRKSEMDQALEVAKNDGKKILGICLGMQLMCLESGEDGHHKGLGWIDAVVTRFNDVYKIKIPHMGWNNLSFKRDDPLIAGIENGVDLYFVHSYYVQCRDEQDVIAVCNYGSEFVAIFGRENIYGIQFHPEKANVLVLICCQILRDCSNMLKKRLIAVLILRDSQVVQSVKFKHTNVIHADALHAIECFNKWSVDEIIILNVSPSQKSQKQFVETVSRISTHCFVPLSVGAG